MELCTMDKPTSHFYKGIGPNNRRSIDDGGYDANGTGDGGNGDDETYSVPYASSNHQMPSASLQQQQHYHASEKWKHESGVECKQEEDADGKMPLDGYLESSNGYSPSAENYNETFHYNYNNANGTNGRPSSQSSSFYRNEVPPQRSHALYRDNGSNGTAQASFGQYPMTAKAPLPAWYNLPQHPSIHHHHPFAAPPSHASYYQQPPAANFYPYHANYMASAATASDHNMRNMIHMTNRNGREARNRAEKHRRDKLNGSIQELSSMVPHVAESPRRVDKTAVLRFSAHGLRIDYVFGKQKSNRYLINPKSTEGLMKLLDTFLLTVTCRGNIVLVSSSVEQYLGHCRSDLYGQSLLNITHPDDHAFLKQQLIPTDLHNLFVAKTDENGEIRSRTKEEEDEIDLKLREDRRDFTIRLARAGPRSEPTQYELVRIDGCFRRAESAPRGRPNTGPTGLQLIRRARGRDDNIPLHSISGNDIILIAMARVMKPPNFCDRLIEACRYEYKTRHLVDGRIVQCDQRISIVAGYMTEEVSGLSPFTFMHRDDVRWVMVALRQMYDFCSPIGDSCYRLMSRTGQFIYLKTRGILEIDNNSRQVHSFICINTLVSDDEGRQLIRDMKRKFSAIISEAELSALESDVPAVENPQLLEHAILNLITNLNNHAYDDDEDVKSVVSEGGAGDKTPLAIIPPSTDALKPSISKAIDVISQVRGKDIQIKDEPKSPESSDAKNHHHHHRQTPSGGANFAVKQEPGSSGSGNHNLLSPTSSSFSVSSQDSDVCSPLAPMGHTSSSEAAAAISTSAVRHARSMGGRGGDDFYNAFENLPAHHFDLDSVSVRNTSSSDSFSSSFSNYGAVSASNETTITLSGVNNNNNNNNNNNSVNVNRNSVLKRTHTDDDHADDDYAELIKKRTLSSDPGSRVPPPSQNPPIDLGSDISDVLSSTFPDDSLTEQFAYGEMAATPQSHHVDELTAEQEEQREILKSLRESCSVIQQTPKPAHGNSNSSSSS